MGCILIFLFAIGVYSLTTILPLFYQTLMGYPASVAGLAVSPRGLGSIGGALIAGLVAKMDVRSPVAAGFGIFGVMNLWNSFMTLTFRPPRCSGQSR